MPSRTTKLFAAFVLFLGVLTLPASARADELATVREMLEAENLSWFVLALIVGIVVAGYLLGRFAPQRRKHLVRPSLYLGLGTVLLTAAAISQQAGGTWFASGACAIARFLLHIGIIEVSGAVIFFVILVRARISVPNILRDILVAVAYAAAAMALLHRVGVQLTSLVAASGLITLVVSLSLQSTLGNVVGGVALQFDGSITEGDWVRLPDGSEGRVRQVRWRHTVVETRNWDTLIVPNSALLNQNILVLGKREDQPVQHRMWVYFQVDFRFSPERVIDVVSQALVAPIERVALTPAPNCICYDLAATERHGVAYYAVRYWLTDLAVDDPTSSAVRARVFAALMRAGIPLGVPPTNVTLTSADDDATRRHRDEEIVRRATQLGRIELFHSLTADERLHVAAKLRNAPFCRGEIITKQGAEAHYLYIVVEGTTEIRVRRGDEGSEVHVASVSAPTIFGEMGLLTGAPRRATVIATSPVECFRLDKADLQDVIHARPELAVDMSKVLAVRKMELDAARDHAGERPTIEDEHNAILDAVKSFFGLKSAST